MGVDGNTLWFLSTEKTDWILLSLMTPCCVLLCFTACGDLQPLTMAVINRIRDSKEFLRVGECAPVSIWSALHT